MSEENGNPTRKDAALPSTTLQIVITYDQVSGAINVNGAIQNYVIFAGIVEAAKNVVKDFIAQNQSVIVRPNGISLVRN